jgi:hypothetical protein
MKGPFKTGFTVLRISDPSIAMFFHFATVVASYVLNPTSDYALLLEQFKMSMRRPLTYL